MTISIVPYFVGAIAMVAWGYCSDHFHERKAHSAIPLSKSFVEFVLHAQGRRDIYLAIAICFDISDRPPPAATNRFTVTTYR